MATIRPGDTDELEVRTGRSESASSSRNGLNTLTLWVRDNTTVVDAHWEKEHQGGIGNWATVGRERVRGANVRFSRTVTLAAREKLRLTVSGVEASPDERRACFFTVSCSEWFSQEQAYESTNFTDTDSWFRADRYLRFYWCGCTCYLVVNVVDREMLIIDAYVSKATTGAANNFTSDKPERRRIVRWVNVIRSFLGQGFKVVGILTSHDHGDHIGDLPYLLGGIKTDPKANFMRTDLELLGGKQSDRVPVFICNEAYRNPRYHASGYDSVYERPNYRDVDIPVFWDPNPDPAIFEKPFTPGTGRSYGRFGFQPYIWYHGDTGNIARRRRTLAYRIWRNNSQGNRSRDASVIFVTTGGCEHDDQVREIDEPISCHHMIFYYRDSRETAASAHTVELLENSPVGSNYIFASHTDKNTRAKFDPDDDREKVTNLFASFLDVGLLRLDGDRTLWRDDERPIRLGYWRNRIGDG